MNPDEHIGGPDGRLVHLTHPDHFRRAVPGLHRSLHTGTVAIDYPRSRPQAGRPDSTRLRSPPRHEETCGCDLIEAVTAPFVTYAHTCGASDRATTYRTIADNARSAWIHRCGALYGVAGSLVGVEFVGNLIVPTSQTQWPSTVMMIEGFEPKTIDPAELAV